MSVRDEILRILNERERVHLTELAEIMGMPRITLYDKLVKLELRGLVTRERERNGRGRPKTFWKLMR